MSSEQPTRDPSTVGSFFDSLKDDYTRAIERCFPRYREMLWALVDYLPAELPTRPIRRILELGCGTGNLSVLLADKYPLASLKLVDLSGESLKVCRSRLGNSDRFQFIQTDFRHLQLDSSSIDMVASSIAVHHLDSFGKRSLFHSIQRWLSEDGLFGYADQFAGQTEALSRRHIENWRHISRQAGSSEAEWTMWMQHQAEHDHHDTLVDQMRWLQEAGFDTIDCVWRYLLWTVLQGRKAAQAEPCREA